MISMYLRVRRFNTHWRQHAGKIRPPKTAALLSLLKVDEINFSEVNNKTHKVLFENLMPLFPDERLQLERETAAQRLTARIVDLVAPIGKGQRALVITPKAGKTLVLQNIAQSITSNNDEVVLIVL